MKRRLGSHGDVDFSDLLSVITQRLMRRPGFFIGITLSRRRHRDSRGSYNFRKSPARDIHVDIIGRG